MEGVKTSQRARLLVLLVAILVLGVLGQSALINGYLSTQFQRLEENQVRASARLIHLWLDRFLQPLNTSAASIAASEAARAAAAGGPADALRRQVAALDPRASPFDAVALVGANGKLIAGWALDPATHRTAALPERTAALLSRYATAPATVRSGWASAPPGLLASASARVAGPHGTLLVTGRTFSADDLAALEDLSATRVSVVTLGTPGNGTQDFSEGSGTAERKRGGSGNRALELCTPLTAALNPQTQLLCLQLQDSIYLRGKAAADDLRLATLSGFVVLILGAWLFLDRALLRRLASVAGALSRAPEGDTRDLQRLLEQDSQRADELGRVSGGMAQLLERVRLIEDDLRRQQRNFRSLTESTGVAIFVLGERIAYANPFAQQLTGYSIAELCERKLTDLLHKNDRERMEARIHNTAAGEVRPGAEFDEVRGMRRDGSQYWARLHAVRITFGGAPAVLITLYDTSEQRHLEAVLAREKESLQIILASIQEGIISLDAAGRVNYLNTTAERLIGHTAVELLGKPLRDLVQFRDPGMHQALSLGLLEAAGMGGPPALANVMTPFGDVRHLELRVSKLLSGERGERPGSVLVLHDVSELRRMAQNLEYQASHDELTGLVNRREFNHRLQDALTECRRNGRSIALCYMDLDQFKTVNDICGHHAGDLLLQQVTAALKPQMREYDTLARVGGDEFGLLLIDRTPEQAVELAGQLRHIVGDVRFSWNSRTFTLDSSVGIAMLSHTTGGIDEALAIADATCYLAREQGGTRVRLYRPGDLDLQHEFGRMRWAQRLKDALDQDLFRLYEQGIHPLTSHTESVSAVEILLRMRDPDGTVVSASDFLDAAERYQMMPAVDRWVVRNVLGHLKLEKGDPSRHGRRYFVNLSGQSLGDDAFIQFLLDTLQADAELARQITFEVTETAAISNLARTRRLMHSLRGLGCTFALDDFGTGMSSFVYLKELSVQYLKIAGPFVKAMGDSAMDEAIVRNLANFGRQLGLKTIAEWVENAAITAALRELRVDYGQGYALSKPTPIGATHPDAEAPPRPRITVN